MKNNNLLAILNDLYQKERSFRDYKEVCVKDGVFSIVGKDVEAEDEHNFVVCFLLLLYYKKIISIQKNWRADDIGHDINSTEHPFKDKLLDIWSEYKNQYPYLQKYAELLSSYNFDDYTTIEDEKTLADWVNDKYLLYGGNVFGGIENPNDSTTFEIISNCEKQLGIDLKKGTFLVNTMDTNNIKRILSTQTGNCEYVFYGLIGMLKTAVTINSILFDHCSHISLLECEKESSISPTSGTYDGVVIQCTREKPTLNAILNIVKDGGFAIVGNYDNEKSLESDFFKYEVPLMFDNFQSNTILIKKVKDTTTLVRYGLFYIYNPLAETIDWSQRFTECIKNGITTEFYQELKKEDFTNTRCVRFNDVKRLPDQLNFVWRSKDEIFGISESEEEWLDNANVDEKQIIDSCNLSIDPFKIAAGAQLYLHNFINKDGDDPHPLSECEIKRDSIYEYAFSIPKKYANIVNGLYGINGKIETEAEKQFDRYLCCRIIKSPCLIHQRGSGFLRVNATEEKPVCVRKYLFYLDEDFLHIACSPVCDIIKINKDYDENFIIYQTLKQKDPLNSKYLLVAPSKEEQHTYFLNKRLDYISQFQPVVDEMEEEVKNSIAESPAHITGIGFCNFRRFVSLPILPFNGVNILVGGNNAGKSSLVKGMLLAIDNIKNYIVDNAENALMSPMFHFDTKNYHDVRVGTFDRAYSHNAIGAEKRTMSFILSCAHFVIELSIEPTTNNSDQTVVPIASILVKDKKRDAEFLFDFRKISTSATFNIENERVEYRFPGLSVSKAIPGDNKISLMIRSIIPKETATLMLKSDLEEKLKAKAGFILEIADELERVIKNINIEYIYAHGVSQRVLFNINDKNDYMAQTLHDFVVENTGEVEDRFIKKCLNDFNIGTDYDVHSIGGEAYIIQIKNKSGKMVYLADLGMGANQLIILIFRLAIIIHKQRMRGATPYKPTIIIEEPEQNMHPAFQSKLASLFFEVNKEYGLNFIVETHSEYLVRKTQVIVAQQKYDGANELRDRNPFMVYYFPSESDPYEMIYRTDGNFHNEFGGGFYDEANGLLFEIL